MSNFDLYHKKLSIVKINTDSKVVTKRKTINTLVLKTIATATTTYYNEIWIRFKQRINEIRRIFRLCCSWSAERNNFFQPTH